MNGPGDQLFSTPAMAAIFSAESHVRAILRFEAALAVAESRMGVIPAKAADEIVAACDGVECHVETLYREAAVAGTVVIPLVRMLGDRLTGEGRSYVHWGVTSQDAIDTAMVLQMRDGLALIEQGLLRLGNACAELAQRHRNTLMAGRTLLQQAVPITFGLKAARWLGLARRQIGELRRQRQALELQFGGAAGTLAALGDRGIDVAEVLADELRLSLPDLPWHAERDRMAGIAGSLSVTAGAMAKIADDVILLSQAEVSEVSEGHEQGKGGSSAMPQKRNPVDCTLAVAAASLAIGDVSVVLSSMTQEHERGAGGWQAEWNAFPAAFVHTDCCVDRVARAVESLEVYPDRMRANLEASGGLLMGEALSMALMPKLGRAEAQRAVKALTAEVVPGQRTLAQVAGESDAVLAVLSVDEIARVLDPAGYLGATYALIDRALASFESVKGGAD